MSERKVRFEKRDGKGFESLLGKGEGGTCSFFNILFLYVFLARFESR